MTAAEVGEGAGVVAGGEALPAVSFAIPCHNERDNLPVLLDEIAAAMAATGVAYEVVVTDDASTDDSWQVLRDLRARHQMLRAQRFPANRGESAASLAAVRAARAPIVVTIDADLQNDPADLPRFLAALEGADCVCGSRVKARGRGDSLVKKLTSRLANGVRRAMLGDTVSDAGCTYRAFRRECLADLPAFRGVHRFLPIFVADRGFRVTEIDVANRSRRAGRSHYGLLNRAVAVIDMFGVMWLRRRALGLDTAERVP